MAILHYSLSLTFQSLIHIYISFFYFIAGIVWIDPKDNPRKIPTIIGLAQQTGACGYAEYPSVFARVSYVLGWIKDITCKCEMFALYIILVTSRNPTENIKCALSFFLYITLLASIDPQIT